MFTVSVVDRNSAAGNGRVLEDSYPLECNSSYWAISILVTYKWINQNNSYLYLDSARSVMNRTAFDSESNHVLKNNSRLVTLNFVNRYHLNCKLKFSDLSTVFTFITFLYGKSHKLIFRCRFFDYLE